MWFTMDLRRGFQPHEASGRASLPMGPPGLSPPSVQASIVNEQ